MVESECKKQSLTEHILELEWTMFTHVQNEGGRASCQDDKKTFMIMRKSQFSVWSLEALESWHSDLQEAAAQGRNVMTEKYGYMMRDTAPEEFEKIEALLPHISEEKELLVQELTSMQVRWRAVLNCRYPNLATRGRCLRREDAQPGETSLETYASGELSTYSKRTLRLLKKAWDALEQQGRNPGEDILLETVKCYGYKDLPQAQQQLKNGFDD